MYITIFRFISVFENEDISLALLYIFINKITYKYVPSQVVPRYPSAHEHSNASYRSRHIPPFKQETRSHSFIDVISTENRDVYIFHSL